MATTTKEGTSYFAHPQALVESALIGPNTQIWAFALITREAQIGANCKIGERAFIESGAVLGDRVTMKNGVAIWDRVTIEDNVFLGPNCVLTNDPTPRTYIKKSGACTHADLDSGWSTLSPWCAISQTGPRKDSTSETPKATCRPTRLIQHRISRHREVCPLAI